MVGRWEDVGGRVSEVRQCASWRGRGGMVIIGITTRLCDVVNSGILEFMNLGGMTSGISVGRRW